MMVASIMVLLKDTLFEAMGLKNMAELAYGGLAEDRFVPEFYFNEAPHVLNGFLRCTLL